MKYNLVPMREEYLDEMAADFNRVYSEPGYEWDDQTSSEYLKRSFGSAPEFCWAAVDENGDCMGGIFCDVQPYYKGRFLLSTLCRY